MKKMALGSTLQGGSSRTLRIVFAAGLAAAFTLLLVNPALGQSPRTFQNETKTRLECSPSSLSVGSPATCVATVQGGIFEERFPSGAVSFKSTVGGKFSAKSCTLVPLEGRNLSGCQVTYTPTSAGGQTITASYGGDTTHLGSQGSAGLEVTPVILEKTQTITSLTCTPKTLTVGAATTCTATVLAESNPSGTVSFKSTVKGKFSATSCTLVPLEGKTPFGCQVTYTPVSAGGQTITASYGGDTTHLASQGSTGLEVTPVIPSEVG